MDTDMSLDLRTRSPGFGQRIYEWPCGPLIWRNQSSVRPRIRLTLPAAEFVGLEHGLNIERAVSNNLFDGL
jgi:hypothetical protein